MEEEKKLLLGKDGLYASVYIRMQISIPKFIFKILVYLVVRKQASILVQRKFWKRKVLRTL